MSAKLKIAVIGCGDIAEVAYLDNLHDPEKGWEVAWVCDRLPARLEWAKSLVPSAKATEDLDDVLADKDVDWVFVLTPLLSHAAIVRKAILAGKNVYTEKPLSMDFDEAAEICALSKKEGVYLASAPIVLLYPVYEYVRGLMLSGAIGQLTSARAIVAHGGPDSWPMANDTGWLFREETATSIPPLPDLGIYGFSYLSHVFGPAKKVTAIGSLAIRKRTFDKVTAPGFKPYTIEPEVSDNCVVTMEYGGGVVASVTANFVAGGYTPDRFEFFGTQGALTMPYKGTHVKIQSNIAPNDSPDGLHDLDISGKTGGAMYGGVNWGPIVAQHLQKAVDLGAEPLVGRDFTLHIIEVITKAMKAAATGQTQTLTTSFQHDKAWGV